MKKYIKFLIYPLIFINAFVALASTEHTDLLKTKVDSFIANEETIAEVVKMIGISSSIPILATPEASQRVVSCHFKGVPLEVCLESLCRANGLWLNVSTSGVLTISTIEQELSSREFYTEDYIEIINVKYPSVFDVGDTIKGLFRDRIVWERPENDADDPYDRIDQAMSRMDLLSERSQFGITNSSGSGGGGSSNNTDFNSGEDLQQFNSLQKTRQSVESSLLEKQKQKSIKGLDSTEKGAEFHSRVQSSLVYLSVLPETNTIMVRSTDRRAAESIATAIKEIDKPRGQVLLKVSVLSVSLSDDTETGLDWYFNSGNFSGGSFVSGAISKFTDAISTSGTSPAVNFITDTVSAQISALKKAGKVKELSTPTLFVADNEAANVFVGTTSKFLDQVEAGTTVNSDSGITTTDPSPTLIDRQIGVSLIITPRVHSDRTVTLRILQERSNIDDNTRTINYGTGYDIDVNDIDEETVVSTLVAKDGQAVLLGGLIKDKYSVSRSGIPVLMDIPYVGNLFATNSRVKERTELIVVIEPYVISIPGESLAASEKIMEELKVNMETPLKDKEIIIDSPSLVEEWTVELGQKEDIGKPSKSKKQKAEQNKAKREANIAKDAPKEEKAQEEADTVTEIVIMESPEDDSTKLPETPEPTSSKIKRSSAGRK
ncbi:MAG: hypothetical protein R3Y46_04910 [Opitutales bacterium]